VAFCFGHTPNSISKKNSCDPIEEWSPFSAPSKGHCAHGFVEESSVGGRRGYGASRMELEVGTVIGGKLLIRVFRVRVCESVEEQAPAYTSDSSRFSACWSPKRKYRSFHQLWATKHDCRFGRDCKVLGFDNNSGPRCYTGEWVHYINLLYKYRMLLLIRLSVDGGCTVFYWCIEFCCNVYWPDIMGHEWHTTQGKGSYESRAEMLHLIVELVQASCIADNPEWRWEQQLHMFYSICKTLFQHIYVHTYVCASSRWLSIVVSEIYTRAI
jgi:hypothetical protein